MSTDAKIIGKRIRRLREAKGWSQREFAKLIHADRNQVISWEKGRSMPILRRRKSLTDETFHVPYEILFGIGEEGDEALEQIATGIALDVAKDKETTPTEKLRAVREIKPKRTRSNGAAKSELAQFNRMMEDADAWVRQLFAEIEAADTSTRDNRA